jgi:hypothetical protein
VLGITKALNQTESMYNARSLILIIMLGGALVFSVIYFLTQKIIKK